LFPIPIWKQKMADDIASLGFAVDSSPLTAAATAADKLSASSKTLESNVGRLGSAHTLAATASTRLAAETALAQKEIGKLSEVTAVIESRMVGMGASMGMVGAVMQTIGPYGIAAAAGLGLVVVTLEKMVESANRLGEFSRMLTESAQTIGLNTDQLQALNIAAESVGVSADSNSQSFGRFTIQLTQLRDGTGTLFKELESVDSGLTRQLASTKDVTAAIDLLARAYASATDQAKKNAIAQAAFGRGGINQGSVLSQIDAAGGLAAYQAGLGTADSLTQDQIKHWSQLSIEIDHVTTLAKNNIASIFTTPILEAEGKFAEVFLEFSRTMKEWHTSDEWKAFVTGISIVASAVSIAAKGLNRGIDLVTGAPAPTAPRGAPQGPNLPAPATFDQMAGGMFGGASSVTTKPQFDLAEMKTWTSFMGSALTAQQQLTEKTLELKAAFDKLSPSQQASAEMQGRYNAALSVVKLESVISIETKRNSILGEMATVQELVKQKQDEINLSVKQGTTFTSDEMKAIQERNRLLIEASKIENQMIFDRQQLFKTQVNQSVDQILRANGIPSASDRAAAIRDYMQMTDALRQMNDVGGTFASGFLTDISHGVNAVDAMRNALTRMADTLIDMAARQLFNSALGGLGSALGLGSSLSLTPGNPGGSAGILSAIHHAGGIVGSEPDGMRYIHSAYYDHAPSFGGGGIVGGEVPVIAHEGEGVFTRGQMAALGGNSGATIHQTVSIDARGSSMTEGQFRAILQANNKSLLKAVDAGAPERAERQRMLGS
jgi:hypothetical protein